MSKYNKETLERQIFEENLSYEEMGRIYECSGSNIKKVARKFGIELPQRRKINECEVFSRPRVKLDGKQPYNDKIKLYEVCDEDFIESVKESQNWKQLFVSVGYSSKSKPETKEAIIIRCENLNIEIPFLKSDFINENSVLLKTKGEIFSNRKNWQSARSGIRNIAQKIYMKNNLNPQCYICGYNKHVEVCHIKPVSEFNDSITIQEINSLDNLVGLCPNCHWEFDNGMLKL